MPYTAYDEIPASEVPAGIIWTTPRRHQGQAVEVSYSRGIPAGKAADMEADEGAPYMRVTDHASGLTTYSRRAPESSGS